VLLLSLSECLGVDRALYDRAAEDLAAGLGGHAYGQRK
jgi:hypothetical protein